MPEPASVGHSPSPVRVAVAATAMLTCHGDQQQSWHALVGGLSGAGPLTLVEPDHVNVGWAHEIGDPSLPARLRPSRMLHRVLREAVTAGAVDPARERTAVVIGTGLGEARTLELDHLNGDPTPLSDLHFRAVARDAVRGVHDVVTLSNACAASGYALAIAADMLELDEVDTVVVAGTDSVTESMLAMIGFITRDRTRQVQPFDRDRTGVLLGEGAAAVVLRRTERTDLPAVRSVAVSCDAHHETAPLPAAIAEVMREAQQRARTEPQDIDLILAHGTGTGLNDPTEMGAITEVFAGSVPTVTGIKGATGHTSGAAALMSLIVAVQAIRHRVVPAVTGLRNPIPGTDTVDLAVSTRSREVRVAQVNAFGFGGVNAVTIVEGAA